MYKQNQNYLETLSETFFFPLELVCSTGKPADCMPVCQAPINRAANVRCDCVALCF